MPKRVIDFDAMWGSDKLAACAAWAQAEYAWLYGLADASGCFEITNLRVIWGRVAAVRGNLTIERLEQVFDEFHDKGLLFIWEHNGKRYAHWTGSDVPGRLPAPSWRMRLERFAPPVPKPQLAEYMARFARGRAAMGGGGFRAEASPEISRHADSGRLAFPESQDWRETEAGGLRQGMGRRESAGVDGIKDRLEDAQAQNLNLDLNLGWDLKSSGNLEGNWEAASSSARSCPDPGDRKQNMARTEFSQFNSNLNLNSNSDSNSDSDSKPRALVNSNSNTKALANSEAPSRGFDVESGSGRRSDSDGARRMESIAVGAEGPPGIRADIAGRSGAPRFGWSAKDLATERELWVGRGPVCGPKGVGAEALERHRKRLEAQAAAGSRGGKT